MVTTRALVVLLVFLAACPAPRSTLPPPAPGGGAAKTEPGAARITWKRVSIAADLPTDPPAPGTYRLHLIDVGTGLSVLVQGADFAMLYDAGSNDKDEKPMRVVAYLADVLGPSGDDLCVDHGSAPTEKKRIENVVLSHPHFDHASAMDLVIHCYDVGTFYDSGRVNDAVFYRELLSAIAKFSGVYKTAADVPSDHTVMVKDTAITIPHWETFHEGDKVHLGEGADFTLLTANAKKGGDPNENSIVVELVLGTTHVLLVGDAESGPRKDPSYQVGDVEEYLLDHHRTDIKADILQVGHHGSKTSSRHDFITAVAPKVALVSSGPKQYGKTVLPDAEVIEELKSDGATVLRTDERDDGCPVSGRIGGDSGPGGCDAWLISIAPPESAAAPK
ncbi:MAG TPA: MBL fold metallo-hydrolase [Kofleriaceae bacterium]